MTQSNNPVQIACPKCGQTYSIPAERWPQFVGRKTACKKCGTSFAVQAPQAEEPQAQEPSFDEARTLVSHAPVVTPPPLLPTAQAMPPMGSAYAPPPVKQGIGGGAIALIVVGVLFVLAIPCAIAIVLPGLSNVRQQAQIAKCASNLHNIAAACVVYANSHGGAYPDSINTLVQSSGLSSYALNCPASDDAPGKCSYVYLGATLNSLSPSNSVVAYEPLSNHQNRGIHVLLNDYSVQWLNAADAQKLIDSIVPGKPTLWPPR